MSDPAAGPRRRFVAEGLLTLAAAFNVMGVDAGVAGVAATLSRVGLVIRFASAQPGTRQWQGE